MRIGLECDPNGLTQIPFIIRLVLKLSGGTNVINVQGTGVFVGGGNVNGYQSLVRANNVQSTSSHTTPTPMRELQRIMDGQMYSEKFISRRTGSEYWRWRWVRARSV